MKMTIELSDFRTAFHNAGRKDQFSYEALALIFEYFEELDPDYDLDVIAICCEYSEASPEDIARDYQIDIDGLEDDEIQRAVLDHLYEHTIVVGVTHRDTIVFAQY
jgi:hypothetical protein